MYKLTFRKEDAYMYNGITLKQARADLKYLQDRYGSANDFCGTFCNTKKLERILSGESTVKEVIIENIEYYFANGIDNNVCHGCSSDVKPDITDKQVQRIVRRYYIQVEQTKI